MTAPKQVWVNECDYTQCTPHEAITGIRYIRADAPELLALVDAAKELLQIRAVWTDPHNDEICGKARAALSAYEAMK